MTVEIEQVCDRVLAVQAPEGFGPALGIALKLVDKTDALESFEGTFATGVFADADLRINRSSGLKFLVLKVRPGAGVELKHLNLARYGSAPAAIDTNPRIPPEGTSTYFYDVRGCRIAFQFTARSRQLRAVSFDWPPRH